MAIIHIIGSSDQDKLNPEALQLGEPTAAGPTHHPDGPAGAQVVAAPVPAVEVGVLSMLEDVLLPSEVRVVKADPSSTLDADGVDPVEETLVLEAVAAATDVQLPACEAFAFVESDLGEGGERARAEEQGHGRIPIPSRWESLADASFQGNLGYFSCFPAKASLAFFPKQRICFSGNAARPAFMTLLAASGSLTHISSRNV